MNKHILTGEAPGVQGPGLPEAQRLCRALCRYPLGRGYRDSSWWFQVLFLWSHDHLGLRRVMFRTGCVFCDWVPLKPSLKTQWYLHSLVLPFPHSLGKSHMPCLAMSYIKGFLYDLLLNIVFFLLFFFSFPFLPPPLLRMYSFYLREHMAVEVRGQLGVTSPLLPCGSQGLHLGC